MPDAILQLLVPWASAEGIASNLAVQRAASHVAIHTADMHVHLVRHTGQQAIWICR